MEEWEEGLETEGMALTYPDGGIDCLLGGLLVCCHHSVVYVHMSIQIMLLN